CRPRPSPGSSSDRSDIQLRFSTIFLSYLPYSNLSSLMILLSDQHTLRISVPFGFSTPSEKFRANRTSPPGAVCTSSSEQFSRTSIFLFSSSSLIYSTHRLFPY